MRGVTGYFVFLFSVFFAHGMVEMDEKALQILEKTSAYYQGLENFKAVYHYTLTIQGTALEEPWTHSAKMVLTVRGEQYRLALDEQETITDGQTVWVHDKGTKEVTISHYNSKGGLLHCADLHNLYQHDCHATYLQEKVINRKKNQVQDVIALMPMDDNEDFTSIQLMIDRATAQIHGFKLVQNEEVSYACQMKRFEVNIALPDDYFIFDVNAHDLLEVIDLREDATCLHEDEIPFAEDEGDE